MPNKMPEKKLNGTVIVTYRCNARCTMCNRYKAPSKPEEEISIETIKKLPKMYFTNITGGEPFIRTDLKDIVRELYKKSDRIVISTNGFFTDRIIDLAKEFPQIGIRISIEGLEKTNNEIRGLQDGFNRGYTTLKKLREMGMKDVGFGMTVQDKNAPDLVPLYKLSNKMGMEFATASLHNSFYFVEAKNIIHDRPMVAKNFEELVNELLRSNSPKKWYRAYFNHGLINYIYGQPRLLPCDMSFDTFFIDPYGDVMPCNGTKDKEVMGNLNTQTWDELWNSPEAEKVRKKVRHCDRNCWMIGSVSPAMHKYIGVPTKWVVEHKAKALFSKHPYSMFELPIVRDYRDGKVTKEELDKLSTCDMNAVVNNGLSEASKEQLKDKTGEEIVDADIANQTVEKEESVKLIVVTHKEYKMPRNPMYLPVCVGTGKDCLRNKYQPDDQGENISDKNPQYCELTALYWAWKNLNCDIFGMVHYRRYFLSKRGSKDFGHILTKQDILNSLSQYDVVAAKHRTYPETLRTHYVKSQKGQEKEAKRQIEILGEVINDLSPEYSKAFYKVLDGHKGHMFNMFVMKKTDLDNYCEWLFDILFEVERRIWTEHAEHDRIMGGLAEFMLDIWCITNNKKIEEFKVLDYGYNFFKKAKFAIYRRFFGKVIK